KDIEKQRETQRKDRKKSGVQSVALLGYTNAGKSTIMNALTGAEVFAEDMLFATLDPTARKREMPSGAEVVFVDTVGFVRKLPHHLIRAFSSTLEESMICDVLLHVVDYSSEEREIEEEIVERLLEKLNKAGKPVIKVYNKIDKVEGEPVGATVLGRPRAMGTIAPTNGGEVFISAKEGQGLDILLEAIENALPEKRLIVEICVPYDKGAAVAKLHEVAAVQEEEYEAGGTRMLVSISQKDYDKVREMINLKE
ncbi:MAG: GTPase HflX, partial [Oscillospiraceae bacterium]|nr:GTPase HflX [Oscillospiraceae bacterium]